MRLNARAHRPRCVIGRARLVLVGIAALWFALGIGAGENLISSAGAAGPAGSPGSAGSPEAAFPWASSFQTAMEQARAEQKYVMIDFYTHWCHWCKVLDQKTYCDPKVGQIASRMVNVKINAEAEPKLTQKYGVRGYPTIVFLNPDGSLRSRVVGFKPAEAFVPVLEDILKNDSEVFALASQVQADPGAVESRRGYAQILARAGRFEEASLQVDSLLLQADSKLTDEERAGLELDGLVYRLRAGQDSEGVRKGLESWTKGEKSHPRHIEGQFFLAQAEEREGRSKQSRKLYQEIAKKQPGTWFAEVARSKLKAS